MTLKLSASLALFAFTIFETGLCHPGSARAAETYVPFDGEKTTWHDSFDRYDYVMDEESFSITAFRRPDTEKFAVGNPPKGQRRCIVVVPKIPPRAIPGRGKLAIGITSRRRKSNCCGAAFTSRLSLQIPANSGTPGTDWLTGKHGLSKKPAFVGMSKGGVNEYDWTIANPTKASCIYADNPAIRPDAFAKLGELARNDVALLNVCGSADFLLQRHTLPIEDRYRQLGGLITVIVKDGPAHHPHSLRNPKIIADWIVEHYHSETPPARPEFAGEKFVKSYYYSLESTNRWLEEEKTYANCRGPGFVDGYDRYDETTSSQWGITGLSVIVPKTVAPGKPWVFRADAITRDAAIDQALLARGFHIVIPPISAQSGAVRTQWDNAYKLMTDHGFSKKPVMEGAGTAAGETYAWAIENPDKVTCILARNPALRSLMTKSPPIDNLSSLAKASVPLLHLCDKNDPWFNEHTKVVEQRYKDLGGQITLIVREASRYPLSETDVARAVDFITAKTH